MLYTEPAVIAKMAANAFLLGFFLELLLEAVKLCEGFLGIDRAGASGAWLVFRDTFYIAACGVIFSVFLYASNNGKIRAVAVICLSVGYLICYTTAGKLVRRLSSRLLKAVHRTLFWLTRPFVFVFAQTVKLLKRITAPVFSRAENILIKTKKRISKK